MYWKAISGLCFILLVTCVTSTKVMTSHGNVEGLTNTLFNGKEVESFLGIPFASAPIGNFRFAPPQPLVPWNGTLQAKALPRPCFQAASEHIKEYNWFIPETPETEDCLYLNLWVPKRNTSNEEIAVMVWIPPGGFYSASSDISMFDGSVLATEQNVIVASMNYRVSMLGFLYLKSSSVPGNMGLQDQIEAIRWIKNNAKIFGGDPNRITLFGESSGAMSVGFHLTNKDTYGLFNNGIMESGAIAMPIVTNSKEVALERAYSLVKELKCPTTNENAMLSCLRSKTPEEILQGHLNIPKYLNLEFVPVRNGIEVPLSPVTGAEDTPPNKRKDLLGGDIPTEGAYFDYLFVDLMDLTEDYVVSEKDFKTMLKEAFGLKDEVLQDIVLFEQRSFDEPFNRSQLRLEMGRLLTDSSFTCPQIHFTKAWATGSNNVYYYSFRHRPSKAYKREVPKWAGVVHGDDIPFVFGLPLNPANGYTKQENRLSSEVMALWGNFAKTGNPNGVGSPNVTWPKYEKSSDFTTYIIGDNVSTEKNYMERTCTFWDQVFPEMLKRQGQIK